MFYSSLSTENMSFLNMADFLKDQGVPEEEAMTPIGVNNKLFTYFDYKNIPVEDIAGRNYKEMILSECRSNIWFFFREIVRIPIPGQPHDYEHSMRFPLNLLTYQMIWCYDHHIPFFALSDGEDEQLRITTLKLLALYNYVKNPYSISTVDILQQNYIRHAITHRDLNVLRYINSHLIPRLLNLDIIYTSLDHSKWCRDNILKVGLDAINDNVFCFDMIDNVDVFKLLSVNAKSKTFNMYMEGNKHLLVGKNDLESYLFSLAPNLKDIEISKWHQEDTISELKKSPIVIIYEDNDSLGFINDYNTNEFIDNLLKKEPENTTID